MLRRNPGRRVKKSAPTKENQPRPRKPWTLRRAKAVRAQQDEINSPEEVSTSKKQEEISTSEKQTEASTNKKQPPKRIPVSARNRKPVIQKEEEQSSESDEEVPTKQLTNENKLSDDEHTSSDADSAVEDIEESKTVLFIQAFPKLSKEQFEALIEPYKNKTRSVQIKFNGFEVTYDPSKGYETAYSRYEKHFDETIVAIKNHMRVCQNSHEKHKVPVNIDTFNLPTDPQELAKIRDELKELKCTDEVYFNAHGNEHLMGLGPITMEAHEIAKAIENLGIPKDRPPHIILWSCKSAKEDEKKHMKTLANQVKEELVKLHYQSPMVTGTADLLFNKKKAGSYVATRILDENGEEKEIIRVANQHALKTYATPEQQKLLNGLKVNKRNRLFTNNLLRSKTRSSRFFAKSHPQRVLFADPKPKRKVHGGNEVATDPKSKKTVPTKG